MLRRRVLQAGITLLAATGTTTAQSGDTECEYAELTDNQIDEILSDKNRNQFSEFDEVMKDVKSGESNTNYIYYIGGDDVWFYDNGNKIYPRSKFNYDGPMLQQIYLTLFAVVDDADEYKDSYSNTDGFEDIDCSEIPFSREPEARFEFSPQNPSENDDVVLDASATTVDAGSVQTYRWEVNGDTLSETGEVVRTTLDSGVNTVTLTVVMESGITKTATETIEAGSVANLSPSFNYDPTSPSTDDTVAFDASGTTAEDTDIKAYEWDFDGDGTVDATGVNAVNKFEKGRHVVSLTVKDTQGNEETTEQILEVDARPVNILITASDSEVEVGGETIIQYSVNNFLSSEELTTQLLVETPSDVNVTGVSGAQGSNQYTAEATVPPGEQQSMRVTIQVNAVGQHEITAIAEYLTTGEQAIDERVSKELLITAVDDASADESEDTATEEESPDSTETEDDSPGFGIGSGLAAIGGAGYMLKRRMKNNNQN